MKLTKFVLFNYFKLTKTSRKKLNGFAQIRFRNPVGNHLG